MAYRETLPRRGIPRRQMMKRVARFSRLKGFDGGLPDSRMPGCERILYNVIGFQPPRTERGGKQSPVGAEASRLAAIKISEGFNLGYCRALPGRGPLKSVPAACCGCMWRPPNPFQTTSPNSTACDPPSLGPITRWDFRSRDAPGRMPEDSKISCCPGSPC